jgi:hypothetical protein
MIKVRVTLSDGSKETLELSPQFFEDLELDVEDNLEKYCAELFGQPIKGVYTR